MYVFQMPASLAHLAQRCFGINSTHPELNIRVKRNVSVLFFKITCTRLIVPKQWLEFQRQHM